MAFINQEAIVGVRPWIVTNEENCWFTLLKINGPVYVVITGLPDWAKGDRKEFVLEFGKSHSANNHQRF
jgi:alpha-L-fucosidase